MTQRIPDQQPWEEMLRQAFIQPREAARQFAQGTRTAAEAWALLAQLHGAADDAVRHWPQRREHACAPDCTFCCFLWTDALPLEVLRIADHLRRTASPEDLVELRQRLHQRLSALDEPLHMLVAAMQEGIERGLAEHGFESGWVELNEALLHAMDLPTPLASWLHKEPIFPWLSQ